jgi:hypothetical protein
VYCVIGFEHLKICAYLKGKGSQVKSFDEPNPIYDLIASVARLRHKLDLARQRTLLVSPYLSDICIS